MKDEKKSSGPQGFAVFVVVFMLILISCLLFLAIRDKREHDANALPAPVASTPTSSPAQSY